MLGQGKYGPRNMRKCEARIVQPIAGHWIDLKKILYSIQDHPRVAPHGAAFRALRGPLS
jgi:hypothetical protein